MADNGAHPAERADGEPIPHELHEAVEKANRFLNQEALVKEADLIINSSALIQGMCEENPTAGEAYWVGFGEYVKRFPGIIDHSVRTNLSRQTMRQNAFGRQYALKYFRPINASVRTMRAEETEHRALWYRAANELGYDMSQENRDSWQTPEMQELLDYGQTTDVRQALAMAKATELIAGALSKKQLQSPKLMRALKGRFGWGEVHVSPEFRMKVLGRRETTERGDHDPNMLEHDDVDSILLVAHDESPEGIAESHQMIRNGLYKFADAALSLERRALEKYGQQAH